MPAPKDPEARKLWIERNRAAHIGMGAKVKVPCPVEGCERHVQAQGLCALHYSRLKRHGSVEATQAVNKGAKCCVDDCERDSFSKGMCRLHYQRQYKTGSTDCEFPRAKGMPGRPMSEENKQKLSAANKGRVWSDEQKQAMSATKKGCAGPWTGKIRGPLTEEWKQAIAEANKGKTLTEEARQKIAATLTGRKRPAETVAKMSQSMMGKRTGPANNRWGKPPAHGKRIEYNGLTFRSSYEVRFVKALDRSGVKWEYESTRFNLGDCTYLPDFYLPETGVYWEIKGWLGPDSQKKIARFREVNPGIPLVVATRPILEAMERLSKVSKHYR